MASREQWIIRVGWKAPRGGRSGSPQRTSWWILRQIAHLYRMEENLRRQPGRSNKRAAVRLIQARPIYRAWIAALVLFKKSPLLAARAFG
jgi:hypothetical protein